MIKKQLLLTYFIAIFAVTTNVHAMRRIKKWIKHRHQTRLHNKLIDAIQGGNLAAVRAHLKRGADVNWQSTDNEATALLFAVVWARVWTRNTIVQELIDNKANPNLPNRNNETPLLYAAQWGYHTIAHLLIEAGAHLDVLARQSNRTALMEATLNGSTKTVHLLLTAGADIDIKDENNLTALDFATICMSGFIDNGPVIR